MKLNTLVEQYIALRDQKGAYKKHYEEQVASVDKLLEKMEAVLLKTFNETGVESVRTEAGTAYKSVRTSASVGDRDAFFNYVKQHDAYELLEARCSKTAVAEYRAANDDLPPGVNWSEETVVGVRRS